MAKQKRHNEIVRLVDEQGYLSVVDLSGLLDVSEMTIRRDLAQLDEQGRVNRTFGGAYSRTAEAAQGDGNGPDAAAAESGQRGAVQLAATEQPVAKGQPGPTVQVDQVDVLVATSVNPYYDKLLLDLVGKKNIPIIAESSAMPNMCTVVAVDNYQAGFDLGQRAGEYLLQQGIEKANLLDLTFQLANTQARSRGFLDGLVETCPAAELVLSINARSRAATAEQITRDALAVHPQINLIFAINDSTARGAISACQGLHIDPRKMAVVTFGLEGETLRQALEQDSYLKAGLAMFPEIVALACIDAATGAYLGRPLPDQYLTPHVVLTAQTLPDYYTQTAGGRKLNWEAVRANLDLPAPLAQAPCFNEANAPIRIGLVVPFTEHEWYQELTHYLQEYASQCGASLHIIDVDQNVQEEVELRRRAIARKAAGLVEAGDVILVDGGPMAAYLAEALRGQSDITVITNSVEAFDTLNPSPGIILISTGGAIRYSSQVLVGPTAEGALKELRADKLFLMVGGISLDFGLSHTNISEVTVKQAMIRSAREVILLADHTSFSTESIIQVAPLSVVNALVTDDALDPGTRLNISKMGIRLLLA
jgi:DeoR/GlpR family transcriptional regulator of sugar metabolism